MGLVGGTTVSLDGLARPVGSPGELGLDGLFAAVDGLLRALALLDDALLALGALAVALGAAGFFLRERVVDDDEDVRFPAADPGAGADRVRELLATGG